MAFKVHTINDCSRSKLNFSCWKWNLCSLWVTNPKIFSLHLGRISILQILTFFLLFSQYPLDCLCFLLEAAVCFVFSNLIYKPQSSWEIKGIRVKMVLLAFERVLIKLIRQPRVLTTLWDLFTLNLLINVSTCVLTCIFSIEWYAWSWSSQFKLKFKIIEVVA